MQTGNGEKGFTLIELIIGVSILSILVALALPAYQQQIQISRRSEAQTALLQMHLSQQNYRLQNVSYGNATDIVIPASEFYQFMVSNVGVNTFTLSAKATSSQASDSGCTTLTLDQSFSRSPTECW